MLSCHWIAADDLLSPLISRMQPEHSSQLSTILLKLSTEDVLQLIDDPGELQKRIDETMPLIRTEKRISWVGDGQAFLPVRGKNRTDIAASCP